MEVTRHDLYQPGKAKYKSVMNILRRAFSFKSRSENGNGSYRSELAPSEKCSIEMSSLPDTIPASPMSSEVASTSRDSLSLPPEAPSVYEDPFVAVTADGMVHIKYYYEFNHRAEFRAEDIHLPHVKKLSRSLKISRLRHLFYACDRQLQSTDNCKAWGITRNDVWWASHLNRQTSGNQCYAIVLDDCKSIRAGFSIVNLEAFMECLKCLGLPEDCIISSNLPNPPLSRCNIPFIDEDIDESSDEV